MKRETALFLALTAASWLIAGVLDLKTVVEISSWNGLVEWTVGTSTLSIRTEIADADSIAVTAQPGLHPTGGGTLQVSTSEGATQRWPLPHKFSVATPGTRPVGDWWVDETTPIARIFSTSVDLGSEFTVRGLITGRHHQYLKLAIHGSPGLTFAFRRGLINNDMLILDDRDNVLASGSIDPQPPARLAALAATLLRAIAGGSLLLALWSLAARPRETDFPNLNRRIFAVALVALALVGGALAAWTAVDILAGLPHLPDEVVYQLQGRWLMSGHLTGAEPPCSDHFLIPLTYFRGGRWIGHYPPMWPLFLVPGIWFGAPWLTPTLLRVLHIVVIGLLGLRLGGRWTALGAAAAALVSPLALLLFGSQMPHAGSATCLFAAILLCLPRNPRTSTWRWVGAGVFFALAFGMRPLTAVAVAVAVGLFHLGETLAGRRRWKDGWSLVIAGLAASLPTLIANQALTGSPWSFPYSLAEGSMYSIRHAAFGIRTVDSLIASLLGLVHGWGWPWLGGPVAMALPFAFVAVLFLSRRSTREDRLLAAIAAAVVLAHLGTRATGLHGFGPRYLFVPCGITWILTSRGAAVLAAKERRARPIAAVLVTLLIVSAGLAIPARLSLYRGYNNVNPDMADAASALPDCSLVLFPADNWRGWAESSAWLGNEISHEALVFAADLGETIDLEWCFPDRQIYRWTPEGMIPAVDADTTTP